MNKERVFQSKKSGNDILNNKECGPTFSGKGGDLSARYEPFNGVGKCVSFPHEVGYYITLDSNGRNMLTNLVDTHFTITELEVWEVTIKSVNQ